MSEQRSEDWLKSAARSDPEAVVEAWKSGELKEVLRAVTTRDNGRPAIERSDGDRDEEWLAKASPEEIVAAERAGELDALLYRKN